MSAGSATVGLIRDACVTSALILFLLGAASVFSQAIVRMNVPGMLTDLLSSVGGKLAFLIVTTLGLIVIGSLTEGVPALFIFAPILVPIAAQAGIDQRSSSAPSCRLLAPALTVCRNSTGL